eukprot:2544772-Rhodomonas_salina.1
MLLSAYVRAMRCPVVTPRISLWDALYGQSVWCYAKSSTDGLYGATRYLMQRDVQYQGSVRYYAMSGTDSAYGTRRGEGAVQNATGLASRSGAREARGGGQRRTDLAQGGMCLRAWYAVRGTGIAYGATRAVCAARY